MQCASCSTEVEGTGVFPGGMVRCACGRENVVGLASEAAPVAPALYRAAASAASAPEVREVHAVSPRTDFCPRCARSLTRSSANGEELQGCKQCGGAFVEHAMLADLVATALADAEHAKTPVATAPPPQRAVRYLRCPHCPEVMQRMNFGQRSGIIVDACKVHGTWFDNGELDAALAFVRGGGLNGQLAPIGSARTTPHDAADPELARTTKTLVSLLAIERANDEQTVREATDFVDDVLWVISPGDRHWAWQSRRRGW